MQSESLTNHAVALASNRYVFWSVFGILVLCFFAFNLTNMLALVLVANIYSGSLDEVNDGAFAEIRDDPDNQLFWTLVDLHFAYLYRIVNGVLVICFLVLSLLPVLPPRQ
jgi:hypothetical protein